MNFSRYFIQPETVRLRCTITYPKSATKSAKWKAWCAYTVLGSHTYNNMLGRPIKYFCTFSNFFTYVRTHVQWFVKPCREWGFLLNRQSLLSMMKVIHHRSLTTYNLDSIADSTKSRSSRLNGMHHVFTTGFIKPTELLILFQKKQEN